VRLRLETKIAVADISLSEQDFSSVRLLAEHALNNIVFLLKEEAISG
jgi:hypothetical protein